jgi:hypothetical protein
MEQNRARFLTELYADGVPTAGGTIQIPGI